MTPLDPNSLHGIASLDHTLSDHLARAPSAHGTVLVVDAAGTVASTGPVDRPFALASVTKMFTATVVHVAVEEGTLTLDTPAGPTGSTVAHLLAHASGLGPDGGVLLPPGRRRIYSNAGYEVLAESLASAAGMSFERYATEAVVEPLGLTATTLAGSPASGAHGSARDVAALLTAWLVPDRLLAAGTVEAARRPFLNDLAGVLPGFGSHDPNPWGLGPEVRGHKSPHWTGIRNSPTTYGHFGRSGTFCWVDPVVSLALVWLGDAPFGTWSTELWPAVSDAVLATVAGGSGRG